MFRNPFRKTETPVATKDPYAWLYTDGYTAEHKVILEQHMDLVLDGDADAVDSFLAEHGWNEDYALAVLAHFRPYTGAQVDAAREAFAAYSAGTKAETLRARMLLAEHGLTLTDITECNKHYWAEVSIGLRDHNV